MYNKVFKTLLREIYYDLNKWRDIPHSLTGRLNIVKMTALPKLIYRFNSISVKVPSGFFAEIDKLYLKCNQKDNQKGNQKNRIAKTSLKRTKLENFHFLILKFNVSSQNFLVLT